LAQRSAQAAKEIEAMMSESGQQVESGVRLVDQTGQSLGRITTQINELTELIRDIAGSMVDQSRGLTQVNAAVHRIDEGTQHNAATAEEATANSLRLASEAVSLARLVDEFKIAASPVGGDPRRQSPGPDVPPGQRMAGRRLTPIQAR
jgi:methyl-accepting chemotaxis protein